MRTRLLPVYFGGWITLITVASYALPEWHMVLWPAIGFFSASAVGGGGDGHRPRRRLPWLLLALSLLTFCVGDITYDVLTDVLGQDNPFPSVADVPYLTMYPLLATGLLIFIRSRAGGGDRGSLLDAITLTSGLALLSWIFLIVPYVRDTELTLPEKIISIAYPLGDVLILATLARLLTGGSARRTPAITLLALGTVGLLAADVLYGLVQLNGSWEVGGPIDLGWVAYYAAGGAAALHPSMVRLTQPISGTAAEISVRRLALLGAASLIAPAVLLGESMAGEVQDAPVTAVLSGMMFLLVLARLSGLMNMQRQAGARERGLREAGAALVSASDAAEVTVAVRQAVAKLLQDEPRHAVALIVADRTASSSDELTAESRAPELVNTDALSPDVAVRLGTFPATLRCPLALDDRLAGKPLAGILYVAAPEGSLLALQGSLEVLASQAAMALDRIRLTDEVNRRNSEAYFRTLVLNTSDVILIIDAENRIQYASPSAVTVFGAEDLTGATFDLLVEPDERDRLTELVEHVRFGVNPPGPVDFRAIRDDGVKVRVELDCRDLRGDQTVAGLVFTLRDVTQRRQLEHDLTHQAFHDSLTGLANRVLFQERVEHAVSRSRRDQSLVGVLFIDLDDFKVVNDTLGHAVGDELLMAVADRITSALRSHDTAARLGGDEFAALIEDATDIEDLEQAAERIIESLRQPFTVSGETVSGVASIGVATTTEATEAAELMRQADLALYVAKGAGKGRWRRYQSDLHTAVLERLELRAALDQAVNEGQFALVYQPIVELNTGTTVGFEALVRWQHPTRGVVPPVQFIDVAEETGLIVPIGRWVLEEALRTIGRWQVDLPPGRLQYLSVNVSARQFRMPGFVEEVRQALEASGVESRTLLLEITESLLLRDDDQIWADLAALRALGVRIAIDDFGTGYSSLSYLRHMPIDVLKIDKSFIDDMVASKQQRAVVAAIVTLAQTLDLSVVAEGIEEIAHSRLLQRMGCPYGQGYLFAKPLPEADAFALLTFDRVAA